MPSIIKGYEYDIFISYRHNDNRTGGVTEFVEHLKAELAATIKEPLNIYFDTNPHDGLLENHNVDKSLEGKLKCLILIPIISQTYCDPKSFAWQHEFCAFNKLVKEDEFGRDIQLNNGNVASRILPVKIHELDAEDTATIEKEIGGVLRAIEFIYKEPGVNRPLAVADNKNENLNKTDYKNQVNKVANAIKEIITAIQRGPAKAYDSQIHSNINSPDRTNPKRTKIAVGIVTALIVLVVYFIAANWLSSSAESTASQASIAILPFLNNTGKTEMDYYGLGVASEIRTQLAVAKQFDFISSMQSTIAFKNSVEEPKSIGEKLGVTHIITGMYQGAENNLQLVVEMVEASTGKIVWSLPFNTQATDFYKLQASVAREVIKKFNSEMDEGIVSTTNLQALAELAKGNAIEFSTPYPPDQLLAAIHYKRAIQFDSSFLQAWTRLIQLYSYHYFVIPEDTTIRVEMIDPLVNHVTTHFEDSWERKEIIGIYTYQVQRDYENAKQLFHKVLDENPDAEIANDLIAAIYKRQLNTEQALKYRTKANKIHNSAGGWLELAIILRNSGNYKDAAIAYKEEQNNSPFLYRLKYNENQLADLPTEIKSFYGKKFTCDQYLLLRDYPNLLKFLSSTAPDSTLTQIEWLAYKLYAHYGLKQDNELSLIAKEIVSLENLKKESVSSTNNLLAPGILAACLSNPKAKLSDFLDKESKQFQQDPMLQCHFQIQQIQLSTYRMNYKDADTRLKQMNMQYPTFGDYAWLNRPEFDRIKEEYSPFQETIDNLKLPPKTSYLGGLKL